MVNKKPQIQFRDLKSLPVFSKSIFSLVNDPRVSSLELNQIIRLDPILAVKVLGRVYQGYHSSGEVRSTLEAVILLGKNTVRNLLYISVDPEPKEGREILIQQWEKSVKTAMCCRKIAELSHLEGNFLLEEFFLCGLIHDIGKYVLLSQFKEKYFLLCKKMEEENLSLLELERENLGLDHLEIGTSLVDEFQLPGYWKDSLLFYHAPQDYVGQNKEIVYAVAIAHTWVLEQKAIPKDWLSVLNLEETALHSYRNKIEEEMNHLYQFLNTE